MYYHGDVGVLIITEVHQCPSVKQTNNMEDYYEPYSESIIFVGKKIDLSRKEASDLMDSDFRFERVYRMAQNDGDGIVVSVSMRKEIFPLRLEVEANEEIYPFDNPSPIIFPNSRQRFRLRDSYLFSVRSKYCDCGQCEGEAIKYREEREIGFDEFSQIIKSGNFKQQSW